MPRTKEQYEEIRREKKRMIMETAMQLFAEEGYVRTSISKIAKRSNISKGLLYNYFESKEDLLKQILLMGVEMVEDAGLYKNNMTEEELIDSISRQFDMITEHRDFFSLYTALSTQPGVISKMDTLLKNNDEIGALLNYFHKNYGENAMREILLFTALSKGYSILALFGDSQQIIPTDSLKKTILEFMKERWGKK